MHLCSWLLLPRRSVPHSPTQSPHVPSEFNANALPPPRSPPCSPIWKLPHLHLTSTPWTCLPALSPALLCTVVPCPEIIPCCRVSSKAHTWTVLLLWDPTECLALSQTHGRYSMKSTNGRIYPTRPAWNRSVTDCIGPGLGRAWKVFSLVFDCLTWSCRFSSVRTRSKTALGCSGDWNPHSNCFHCICVLEKWSVEYDLALWASILFRFWINRSFLSGSLGLNQLEYHFSLNENRALSLALKFWETQTGETVLMQLWWPTAEKEVFETP